MLRSVEAVIDEQNNVRLLEPVQLPGPRRAFVIILDEPAFAIPETALLSEPALEDWNRPEEETAWSYLQQAA
jgi:hypothetical protein